MTTGPHLSAPSLRSIECATAQLHGLLESRFGIAEGKISNGASLLRKTIRRLLYLFVVTISTASLRGADMVTVTICDEIEEILFHPAEYVQEKVRRNGIRCLLQPHCCTPAWVVSPDCYIYQWVMKRDAWDEVVKTYNCEDYEFSPEDALQAWLRNVQNPVPGFRILTGGLTELFGAYITAAYEAGEPLPNDVKSALKIRIDTLRLPFTERNMDQARWLKANHPLARRIHPSGNLATTYYNLIIVTDAAVFTTNTCFNLSEWAHELTHVHQYNELGWEQFLEETIKQTIGCSGHYEATALEQEAEIVERQVLLSCNAGAVMNSLEAAQQAKISALNGLIAQLQEDGELEVSEGKITKMSAKAEKRLKREMPNLESRTNIVLQRREPAKVIRKQPSSEGEKGKRETQAREKRDVK